MTAARVSRRARTNLITDAQEPASADLNSRQIRYSITMAFRVACFIAMIWVPGPYRWVLLLAAIVLPYVAVVFANQADQRSSRGSFEKGVPDDRQLTEGDQLRLQSRVDLDWDEPHPYAPRPDDIEGETEPAPDETPAPDENKDTPTNHG